MHLNRLAVSMALLAGSLAAILGWLGWQYLSHEALFSAMWKTSFVSTACFGISYFVRARYSDLLDHVSLNNQEFDRLADIVNVRRRRITLFVLFSLVVSFATLSADLVPHGNEDVFVMAWFLMLCVLLGLETAIFALVLLSLGEIEAFKSKLDTRSRKHNEQERLLNKLHASRS